jgi:hypothetical protein
MIPASKSFDYIIGNPPYSDRTNADCGGKGGGANNLDSDFTLRSIELAERVLFVIRAKHFLREPSNFRRQLFQSGHLRALTYVHPSNFPSVQNTQTVIVDYDKQHDGTCAVTYEDGSVLDRTLDKSTLIKLNNPEFELEVPNNMKHRHMYGKLSRNKIVDANTDYGLVEIMGKKGEPPTLRYTAVQQTDIGRGMHGVIMNYNSTWTSLGKMCVKDPAWAISGSIVMIVTKDNEEAERLLKYLQSYKVSEIVAKSKRSFSNSKYVFALIPDLDAV